jgi:hypothetical protein
MVSGTASPQHIEINELVFPARHEPHSPHNRCFSMVSATASPQHIEVDEFVLCFEKTAHEFEQSILKPHNRHMEFFRVICFSSVAQPTHMESLRGSFLSPASQPTHMEFLRGSYLFQPRTRNATHEVFERIFFFQPRTRNTWSV